MNTEGYTRCRWHFRGGLLEVFTPWSERPLRSTRKNYQPEIGKVLWDVWAMQTDIGIKLAIHYVTIPVDDLFVHFMLPHLERAKKRDKVIKKYGLGYQFRSLAAIAPAPAG